MEDWLQASLDDVAELHDHPLVDALTEVLREDTYATAGRLLRIASDAGFEAPFRITISMVNAIAIRFHEGSKWALFEVNNDGTVSLLLADREAGYEAKAACFPGRDEHLAQAVSAVLQWRAAKNACAGGAA